MSISMDHLGQIHVVIFTASYRLCRKPQQGLGPIALWPVLDRPAIWRIIQAIMDEGIRSVTVYSDHLDPLAPSDIPLDKPVNLRWVCDPDIAGTAGMLRLAVPRPFDGTIVIMPANMANPPSVLELVEIQRSGGAALTLFSDPQSKRDLPEIYACDADVLEHIPSQGYWDIKERLIPDLAILGKVVRKTNLPYSVGCFYDGRTYLQAVLSNLSRMAEGQPALVRMERFGGDVWVSPNSSVGQSARMYGHAIVMDDARIADKAVVIGPAVIGPGACVDGSAAVVGSCIWEGAQIGSNSLVNQSLVGRAVRVGQNAVVENQVLVATSRHAVRVLAGTVPVPRTQDRGLQVWAAVLAAAASIAMIWSFWPQWLDLWYIWQASDEYSAGMLVPALAGYVLWCRRASLRDVVVEPCIWGMVLLVLSQAMRLYGLYQMRGFIERSSVVIGIMGLVLWLGGRQLFRKTLSVLLFLLLMLPWPNRLHGMIALPLQSWSTASAVFGLELLGYDVVRHGNVIQIGQTTVAVAEACNGLRMITAFFVISGLLALLVNRAWWEKLVMLISSLPIALACNTFRLIVTAIAFTIITGPKWEGLFHDLGGYAMMPLAVALIMVELWVLRILTTAPTSKSGPDIIVRSARKDSV